MSRVRNRDTDIETLIRSHLHKLGYRYSKHSKEVPGKPDIVFNTAKVAVFLDGDFWHGYRFNQWKDNIPDFWKQKIAVNIARDLRNHAKLRRMGWQVIRVWQHEVWRDPEEVLVQIISYVECYA